MNELAYLSGWVVAAVLGYAGVAKVGRPDIVAGQFRALGLGRASAPLALIVPPVELIVALALVTAPRLGGAAAALLFAAFTTVLVAVVRRDVGIGCACFGGVSDRPVGRIDLLRNATLIGAALFASTAEVVRPSLPALVIVSVAVLGSVIVGTLVTLRSEVGTLWIGPDVAQETP